MITKEECLARLAVCAENPDTEDAHAQADGALLDFIDDPEIGAAWLAVDKRFG